MLRFRITIIVLFLLGLTTMYFNRNTPEIQGGMYARSLPKKIGEWYGVDIPVDPLTISILETEDILSRRYILREKVAIVLNVVFSQDNRRAVHPPEVCYRASGWEFEKRLKKKLEYTEGTQQKSLYVTEMEGFRPGYRVLILYWYKSGKDYTPNFYKQQVNVAFSQILNRKTTAALISLAIAVPEGNEDEAREKLEDFASLLVPYISKSLP